jgi:hypothetical protein
MLHWYSGSRTPTTLLPPSAEAVAEAEAKAQCRTPPARHAYSPLTPITSQGRCTFDALSSLHGSRRAGGDGPRPRFPRQGELTSEGSGGAECVGKMWEKRAVRSRDLSWPDRDRRGTRSASLARIATLMRSARSSGLWDLVRSRQTRQTQQTRRTRRVRRICMAEALPSSLCFGAL